MQNDISETCLRDVGMVVFDFTIVLCESSVLEIIVDDVWELTAERCEVMDRQF